MDSPSIPSGPVSGAPAPSRAAFVFIFVTVVLDMLSLGIIIPVLPRLILAFEGGDMGSAASIAGVFGFAWAAMQFFFSPLLGAVSDRYGRRPVILLSNFGLGVDYIVMAVAPSLGWLFAGRVISGITSASFSTAGAYIADVTPPEGRAARFGMLGAAFGLGFIVGPAVGGLLGGIDLRFPFWAAAVLSLANAAYGFFILPESLPPEKRAQVGLNMANPLGSLTLLRSHPELLGLAMAAFLYFVAHESLPSLFVLYTDHRFAWDERTVGLCLAAVGVGSMLVSGALVGPAVTRLGERRVLLAALAFGILGFAAYGLAPVSGLFVLGIPLISLCGMTSPSIQALMSQRVGPQEQGQLQGAISSIRGIGGMIGPLLFTQVFAVAIARGRSVHLHGAAYVLASLLLVGSLLLSRRVAASPRA